MEKSKAKSIFIAVAVVPPLVLIFISFAIFANRAFEIDQAQFPSIPQFLPSITAASEDALGLPSSDSDSGADSQYASESDETSIFLSKRDCAVVLTGGEGRIEQGLQLLKLGYVRRLIVSGVFKDTRLTDLMDEAYEGVVRRQDVILEKTSQTTYGNAHQSLAIVKQIHCQSIYLVTSRAHMFRAYRVFKKIYPEGYDISPLTSDTSPPVQHFFRLLNETLKSILYDIFLDNLE